MGSKSSGEDNLLYEREQSKEFRITDSTSSNKNIRKDSELWAIAGKIHIEHTRNVGTILHFPSAKLNNLERIYSNQPQQMFYVLLKKWCDVVKTKYENHRRLLAKVFFEAEYKNISDSMNEDISEVTIPPQLTDDLSDVCFDIPGSNETRSTRSDQAELWHAGPLTETHYNLSRKDCMLKMLKELKLEELYPSKISLPMINKIVEKSPDEEVTIESIPWLLLRKFMNLNYEGREADLNALYECHDDEHDDFSTDRPEKNDTPLHPLDVFLLTFLCCDPILQQELISKMFFCRVAVPFIYHTLEDTLIMSKWAFRKIIITRKNNNEWVDEDALSQHVKIVSFLRIGPHTHETVSKSNLINEIMSQKHSTFFNRKACTSFETKKLITNGMVEASWFIPSYRSYDDSANIFQDVLMFLNLRGDCLEHEEEVRIVSSISDVIIVLININILNKSNIVKHLQDMHSLDKCLIYGIECRKGETEINTQVQDFRNQYISRENKSTCIRVDGEITRTLVEKFIKHIRNSLSNKKAKQFSEVISNFKFGDDRFSFEDYTMSKDIMDFIGQQPVITKSELFPLQDIIWAKLCTCTKQLFKSKSEEEKIEISNIHKNIQQEQFNLINKSGTLQQFTRNLLKKDYEKESTHTNNDTLYFIAWLKSFMDENSRAVRKYKQTNFKLVPCYDHLIREMGQAFSIVNTFPQENKYKLEVGIFPSFVSGMLQFGFPFELMDGDTSMVPLKWVEAILHQLKADIGNKKMYIISVLGIQSSGKSTLLNTMFGLHFAVSAGRCTRGVFMQLIKVKDRTLPFDYILILDTEGICGEENRRVFENELATFAIGLGNIIILNIKGENTTEIENFLQIAVYACQRLKSANQDLKMEQRCVFVHQNVNAIDAQAQLKDDRDTRMKRLDEMVEEAAKSQDRSNIKSFNQVIGINPESDVFYFTDLWQGNPPMATVNLGYSADVLRLKTHMLHNIAKKHGTSYTLEETITRINDFCRGILMDDFVFSFRNSLEINVYRDMDSCFQGLIWKPELKTDEWIYTTVSEKIARCTENKLESVCEMLCKQLLKTLTESFSLIKDEFESFIDNHRFKNIMDQYRQSRTLQLDERNQLLETKGQYEIQRLKKRHQSFLDQLSKLEKHKRELKRKAQDLVDQCKTAELSEEDTIEHFDRMWNEWLEGIDSKKDDETLSSVEKIIEKKLFEMFRAEAPMLIDQIQISNRDEYRNMKALHNSVQSNQLHEDHITSKSSMRVDQTSSLVFLKHKRFAVKKINIIMQKIDDYISPLQNDHLQFKESYATSVFMYLIEGLEQHNSSSSLFSLTTTLRAKLAVHVKMYIVETFTNLNNKWHEKNDMKTKIQSEKQTYLDYFISIVKDQTMEMRMANLFLSKIKQFIIETVSGKLPSDVIYSIYPDTFKTKYILMVEIMTDLVKKSDFVEFKQYIDDSSVYALDWLTKYINNKMFTCNGHDNEYTQLAEKHITNVSERIKKSIDDATPYGCEKQEIRLWYNSFAQKLKNITVPNGIFLTDIGDETVDVYNYKKLIGDKFENLVESIKEHFKNQNAENVKWTKSPYRRVFNKLWGCNAVCPFCKEPCQKKAQHTNEQHSCIQHRPPAVWGIRKQSTGIISMMNCNSLVYSKETFLCDAIFDFKCKCPGKCEGTCKHLYREYKKLIPGWIIEPSPLNEVPKYWSWFVSKFQNELCKLYRYKISENETISKDDAIKSLAL